MTALDYILEGLEAELALERELGVRTVECDRELLTIASPARVAGGPGETRISSASRPSSVTSASSPSGASSPSRVSGPSVAPSPAGARSDNQTIRPSSNQTVFDFVFLHDKPLSAKGNEMMAKIIHAMGRTGETAPVIVAPPFPKAKAYVVLGALALRKWFPGVNAAPGQWVTTSRGEQVLVTYSPEYILRFGEVTPALKKIKSDMWTSLKGVLKRV